MKYGWRLYGRLGLFIILAAEVLLFLRVRPFTIYFTPIVWSGYILLVDSLIYGLKGESLLTKRFRKFSVMLLLSIVFWYVFEFYNLFIKNWHYIGLPENRLWRYLGYFWSFATIWPAILLTYELILMPGVFKDKQKSSPKKLSRVFLSASMAIGVIFLLWPVLAPSPYLAVPVWLGFVLLLDPINYLSGEKSIFGDWVSGKRETIYALFLSGLICGFLWEFWNYWAEAKWEYAVPILDNFKIFEMPIVGYLGFMPFACEAYVMYNFAGLVWRKLKPAGGVAFAKSPGGASIQE